MEDEYIVEEIVNELRRLVIRGTDIDNEDIRNRVGLALLEAGGAILGVLQKIKKPNGR